MTKKYGHNGFPAADYSILGQPPSYLGNVDGLLFDVLDVMFVNCNNQTISESILK